jgi:hypothetical protein
MDGQIERQVYGSDFELAKPRHRPQRSVAVSNLQLQTRRSIE